MEKSPVELVLCLRDFGQGNHRIILTPSAFKFSNFSSVNCSILLNKKNDSNKIKTNRQGQKEQNMHSFLATRGPRVIRTGGSVAGFARAEVTMRSLEDHLRSR